MLKEEIAQFIFFTETLLGFYTEQFNPQKRKLCLYFENFFHFYKYENFQFTLFINQKMFFLWYNLKVFFA